MHPTRLYSKSRTSPLLRAGILRAQETDYAFWFRWVPQVLPALCAKALSIGVQPDFVREVIRRFQLAPSEGRPQHWPWPLKVTTFGGVLLARGDIPVDLSKRARKPLELLKAIIVCGGQDIDVISVAEMLWPDADGDAAQKAFDITLHRLRKQLGDERALILRRGTISIDPKTVWVDLTAFRDVVDRIEALDGQKQLGDVAVLTNLSEVLFDLYRGRFLAGDLDLAWAIPPRDRLHASFLRALATLGKAWEVIGEYAQAIVVYRRGLQVDQGAEALYQQLMACCQKSGRLAEAAEAYERCQQALGSLMGRQPSRETEGLGRSIPATKTS